MWVDQTEDLWQGHFIDDFDLHRPTYTIQGEEALVARDRQRIVILTQSCDLVAGIEDTRSILIAPVTEVPNGYKKSAESISKFQKHIFFPLQRDDEFNVEFTVVRLDAIQVAPLGHLREVARTRKTFRLQSNYVEHLSHFVGVFISRVALPDDALDRNAFVKEVKGTRDTLVEKPTPARAIAPEPSPAKPVKPEPSA